MSLKIKLLAWFYDNYLIQGYENIHLTDINVKKSHRDDPDIHNCFKLKKMQSWTTKG